ncbi:MAG: exodeoxyribonuclease VII large subunit [Planctomycetota bacterium]|nr:exodeoxyribonuclease VII large subunit [Planctomycetota bacterium]
MSSEGFFEVHQRLKGRDGTARGGKAGSPVDPSSAMTVTQLTSVIDRAVRAGVPASVVVRGEVSNASSKQASGHLYFTLKDAGACIGCVMWRSAALRLAFKLEDGAEMIATGEVSVYAPQGKYQLVASSLQPVGKGALELAFRQLQAKLAALGLFAAERKRAIPRYPRRIVLVTSRSTAAIADMLKVLRRYRWVHILLYHVPVQGEGAGVKIASAIGHLNERAGSLGGVDAILLSRGGGSLEDLWAFNEEVVAHAIAASLIPIVTGIGHETDCSIADLVADYHAHTPTEAAQIIVQHWKNVADHLGLGETRLRHGVRQIAQESRQRFNAIERHAFFRRPLDRIFLLKQLLDDRQRQMSLAISSRLRDAARRLGRVETGMQEFHPRIRIALQRQNLSALQRRLETSGRAALKEWARHVDSLDKQLRALSPDAVLGRGYSMTRLKKGGAVVRDAAALKEGDRLVTRFQNGEAESIVQDSRQLPLFE